MLLYVLLGISVAMSFVAGVEFVLLADTKNKYRRLREKYMTVSREIECRENRNSIVKELEK